MPRSPQPAQNGLPGFCVHFLFCFIKLFEFVCFEFPFFFVFFCFYFKERKKEHEIVNSKVGGDLGGVRGGERI